jgi:hypothetical protein
MPSDRVLALFKFGRRAHIEQFVDGCLYMNALRYFVGFESNAARHDSRETQRFWMQPGLVTFSVKTNGEFSPISGLDGPIAFSKPEDLNINVFCMYALRASVAKNLVDPRNLEFGDSFAVLTDGDEFLRRVRGAAEQASLALEIGMVEYVNERDYQGEIGIFRKSSMFAYQSELRFALKPGTGAPYQLDVGDLTDITFTGPMSDLNQLLKVD